MLKLLTSKDNPKIKDLSALIKQKGQREKQKLFVAEGAKLCDDIMEAKLIIKRAFISSNAKNKYPEQTKKLLEIAKESWEISNEVAHWVADTKTPQGLFIVCKRPDNPIIPRSSGSYIILDNLQDPGNVGTIIRTALSLGIDGAFVSEDSAEIYSPKLLRSSMGAVIKLPIAVTNDIYESIMSLKALGIKVYAAALGEQSVPVEPSLFAEGSGVLLGNEGKGLSEKVIAMCDKSIIIPMSENAESLNVGVAAGILMWEIKKGKM